MKSCDPQLYKDDFSTDSEWQSCWGGHLLGNCPKSRTELTNLIECKCSAATLLTPRQEVRKSIIFLHITSLCRKEGEAEMNY